MGVNYPVNVTCANGNTSASNLVVRQNRGTAITITWSAAGNNTFSSSNPFFWKSSTNPGTLPTRSSDGKTLTLNYDMPSTSVNWSYGIKLHNCNVLDPEIENQVPPTPDPDEPPQGGGGGTGGGQPGGGQPGGGGGQPGGGGGQPGGGGGNPGGGNPGDRN